MRLRDGNVRLRLRDPLSQAVAGLLAAVLACSQGPPAATVTPPAAPVSPPSPSPEIAAVPAPAPTPDYPPFYIEALRTRAYPGGKLEIGEFMWRGAGFTKYRMSWPSGGQTMTGTISLPDGPGPYPVVVVNHGHIPAERYWVGQDSGIFGDPMAAHGFIAVAPDYPGHAGSGPGPEGFPEILADTVTVLDLVSSLASLPQADMSRIAMAGHSNGGGVCMLTMVIDRRVKAFAIYAPASSDMADNARKWWYPRGAVGSLGNPDTNPDGYAHISPRFYFEPASAPAIFFQGTADQSIPAEWTVASFQALQSKGVKTNLVWFPGAAHDMAGSDLASANAQAEAWIREALSL
jgi:dipeptidyl aminopeptidase/acylaminoacyl peptidase